MDLFEKSNYQKGRFVPLSEFSWENFWNIIKWKWTSRPIPWPAWRDLPALLSRKFFLLPDQFK